MADATPSTRSFVRLRGNTIEVFGRSLRLPANRLARMGLGLAFIVGGLLSFLPVLGIWMLPVGLLILSIDLRFVRRWRRRTEVRWGRRQRRRTLLGTTEPTPRELANNRWRRFVPFARR